MNRLKFKINNEIFYVWHLKGPKNSPIIHWSHANGFNAPTYYNLLKTLSEFCTIYAWDARAHGLNHCLKPPLENHLYETYQTDLECLIKLLYEKHSEPIILAGHSFGATIAIKAEAKLKGKISCLLLADPVLFTPFAALVSQILRKLKFKRPKSVYLAQNAKKRKENWASKEIALHYLNKKNLFKRWDKIALQNYINYGTINCDKGVTLRCPRKIESLIFKESESEFLSKEISKLSVPTYVYLASKGSPAFAKNSFKKSRKTETLITIPSTSHLFPIEHHEKLSRQILKDVCKIG